MVTQIDNVARLYDSMVELEESRLLTHPMERELTLRTIRKALAAQDGSPGPKRIADIGGGPGKVAFALADSGHAVDLIDLSPALIASAQREQRERLDRRKDIAPGATHGLLQSIAVGNALDKCTALEQESYDAVLLLGPLYHLVNEDERVRAVQNALDLVKTGEGLVLCAFISVAAHLRDLAMRDPTRLLREKGFYSKYLRDGRYEKGNEKLGFSVQSFHTTSADIRDFFARHFYDKVELLELRATEGILGGGLDAKLQDAGPETIAAWTEVMFEEFSAKEEFLGCADHLLAVLRKK